MKMRLDKFLSSAGAASRSECARAAKRGSIRVNGEVCRLPDTPIDPDADTVTLDGSPIVYRRFVYLMMNKPDGVVSATEDGREKTVTDLLPPDLQKRGLFPCGRLDKHTVGLLLLTDNGPLAHRLLSPKHHVTKVYRFTCKFPLTGEECRTLEAGVTLDDGYVTRPARVTCDADGKSGNITLTEGKYHEIKRMWETVHNQITTLERIAFGPLSLDDTLPRGAYRFLTEDEIRKIEDTER